MSLLCMLGFHKWFTYYHLKGTTYKYCLRCYIKPDGTKRLPNKGG
jgi:hypothetical protein